MFPLPALPGDGADSSAAVWCNACVAALNHLDVFEMHSNYRMEQGYTYQLNLMGDGDDARDAFLRGERAITR